MRPTKEDFEEVFACSKSTDFCVPIRTHFAVQTVIPFIVRVKVTTEDNSRVFTYLVHLLDRLMLTWPRIVFHEQKEIIFNDLDLELTML